MLFTLRKPGFL